VWILVITKPPVSTTHPTSGSFHPQNGPPIYPRFPYLRPDEQRIYIIALHFLSKILVDMENIENNSRIVFTPSENDKHHTTQLLFGVLPDGNASKLL
jgi:hypothetical protein